MARIVLVEMKKGIEVSYDFGLKSKYVVPKHDIIYPVTRWIYQWLKSNAQRPEVREMPHLSIEELDVMIGESTRRLLKRQANYLRDRVIEFYGVEPGMELSEKKAKRRVNQLWTPDDAVCIINLLASYHNPPKYVLDSHELSGASNGSNRRVVRREKDSNRRVIKRAKRRRSVEKTKSKGLF